MNSSDLELACTLSRKLAVRVGPKAFQPKPDEPKNYLRFTSPELPSAMEELPTPVHEIETYHTSTAGTVTAPFPVIQGPATESPMGTILQDFPDWKAFLAWALSVTIAEAAFVVDYEGFVIATEGRVPPDGFEGTGATLCYSMDQLSEIDPTAGQLQSIDLKFGNRTIFGLRVSGDQTEDFIIGLVSAHPLDNAAKQIIAQQVGHNIAHLR